MFEFIPVITFVALFFGAMILRLATNSGFANKFTGWLVVFAACGGFVFYGYSYAIRDGITFLAVIRALLSVCGMFTGSVDEDAISGTVLESNAATLTLFWLIHLMALYATASATISVIGTEALRKLKVWFPRRGELYLIFGANTETVSFAHKLSAKRKCSIVFIDPCPADGPKNSILKSGFLLRSDTSALRADTQFAKSLGIRRGRRKIILYALHSDSMQNLTYAKAFLLTLELRKIKQAQTSLFILSNLDNIALDLSGLSNSYGYGSVTDLQEDEMIARLLIQQYPPYKTLSFDSDGHATEDFHALVIGFGSIGQAVLRHLVMNGQFAGSNFRCDVFSPNCYRVGGFLYPRLQNHYSVNFISCDGKSPELYAFLRQNIHSLKYIAICTGSVQSNQELAIEISNFCRSMAVSLPVYQCSHRGIVAVELDQSVDLRWIVINERDPRFLRTQETPLFDPSLMCYEYLDAAAMQINKAYSYNRNPWTAQELWTSCDRFTRLSCRAVADFIPALLKISGLSVEEFLQRDFSREDAELLERLAMAEHIRWCGFLSSLGFESMPWEDFQHRMELYLTDVQKSPRGLNALTRDLVAKKHLFLVPWDQLDVLSRKLSHLKNSPPDFKQMDREQICMIQQLLQQDSLLRAYYSRITEA